MFTQTEAPALSVRSIAAYARGPKWQFEPHAREDAHTLVWVSRGGGRVQIDGTTRGFGPNVAIFLPAGAVHAFEFTQGAAGWVLEVLAGPVLPWSFPDMAIVAPIVDRASQQELVSMCEEVSREQQSEMPARDIALRCRSGLVSVWVERRLSGQAVETETTRAAALVRRFSREIEANVTEQKGVAAYAESLGVTPTHLSRVCREVAGKSASQIIQDRTLLEARRRLAVSEERISDIAHDLGFSSPAHFTRLFTQKIGTPPSTFRQQSTKAVQRPEAR